MARVKPLILDIDDQNTTYVFASKSQKIDVMHPKARFSNHTRLLTGEEGNINFMLLLLMWILAMLVLSCSRAPLEHDRVYSPHYV
jgi:hypothetical protein